MKVSMNNVTKSMGGNVLFEDISFQINNGEHVGFIGRNGEGKTTILELIYGNEAPDKGEIFIAHHTKIGYAAQMLEAESNQTVRAYLEEVFVELMEKKQHLEKVERELSENYSEKILQRYGRLQEAFIESGGYEMETAVNSIATGLGIRTILDEKWSGLSGGQKTRASLARLLLEKADLLLLDEPTNHLDIAAIDWLASYLNAFRGTVFIVSHDRYFIDQTCSRIIELEHQQIDFYHTNYTGYIDEKEKRVLKEFEMYKQQKQKIKKMEEAIRNMRQWAHEADNESMYRRAKSMEKALARIERLDNPLNKNNNTLVKLQKGARSGKEVVVFNDVTMAFDDHILFEDINFQINANEKCVLMGANGTGKSTILKLLLGNLEPALGEVKVGPSVKIAYLSQQMEELDMDATILDTFRSHVHVAEEEARHILAKYLFYGKKVFQKLRYLSGGELMRLRLAWFVSSPVNFLVFDEPTNHLDIPSREALEEQIEAFDGTVLVVSHDRYFINKLFQKIYLLEDGKITEYLGNYDEMQSQRNK